MNAGAADAPSASSGRTRLAPELRRAGAWGAALTALVGLVLWCAPGVKQWLSGLSFDSLALARGTIPVNEVIIVGMDEESYGRLGQSPERLWDRSLHARLLDTLTARGARAVVFDVAFADQWPDPNVDLRFAEALQRASGKVVLAGSLQTFEVPGVAGGSQVLQPIERFASVAPWGVVELGKDPGSTLRRLPNWPQHTSLARRAAEVTGVGPPEPEEERWLNYYGPGAFRKISYWQALQAETLAPDTFSNKVVFVGKSHLITAHGSVPGDEYPIPDTRWTGQLLSGVEIQATAFLNLWRRDWLKEPPGYLVGALFIFCGALLGFGLALLRPIPALLGAAVAVALAVAATLGLFWSVHVWFPWLIVAGAQVPCALGWSVLSFFLRAARAKDIPDHTLLRCVGRGGYGEVWLARDVIGGFHAVKLVYRKKFPSAEPFEREFRGIQKFAPISRAHAGLVQVLHVGRNDLRGCFYYIMEAADDETRGADIQPELYVPRTLARDIARRARLPVSQCVQLGLDLTSALDSLHQRQLIHRDIKPANIIFVSGQPKLADVGLVTGMASDPASPNGQTVTRVGTSGYLAPEGPGTAQADLYALGKTLYEAATGCECSRFPELPTDLSSDANADDLLRLHEILLTACETDPADRYPSAAAMRAELLELKSALAGHPGRYL